MKPHELMRAIQLGPNVRYRIPILYITQLMGLAFGAFPKEVGIQKLFTTPGRSWVLLA